jgi:UTP--glucose-1-phosphate uridylyltransferase
MVDDYNKSGNMMIGVQEVPKDQVDRYGIVKLKKGTMQIEDIIEKPSIGEAPSCLADFGRMILNQEIIDVLKTTALGKGNELWVVDAIRTYIKNGGKFYAKEIQNGKWLTTGDPLNYLKAILAYAVDRKDINGELVKYLQELEQKK